MEYGNSERKDSATGLISDCNEKGECLIYTEAGDIVGRFVGCFCGCVGVCV